MLSFMYSDSVKKCIFDGPGRHQAACMDTPSFPVAQAWHNSHVFHMEEYSCACLSVCGLNCCMMSVGGLVDE